MLAQYRHHLRRSRAAVLLALLPFIAFAPACDKVPLLAPGGTVITMFPTASTVPLNGEVEIVATAIENGTTHGTADQRHAADDADAAHYSDDDVALRAPARRSTTAR